MAKVTIIRHKVSGFASAGGAMPIADSKILGQQVITTSSTSQAFNTLAAADENEAWTVLVEGGRVSVKFGEGTPVATATDGWPLPDGTMKPFAVPKGFSAAVIDAP